MTGEVTWWPNWYCRRLHVVRPTGTYPSGATHELPSLCGNGYARSPEGFKQEWQKKAIASGTIPKCKSCLTLIGEA